jgi:Ca2+-binding RTX toxin-like protein
MFRAFITNRFALVGALSAALVLVSPAFAAGPPANDHFVNSQGITGGRGEVRGFTLDGTKEAGEPNHAGDPGGHSIWYRWSAPRDGSVRFSTAGSDFDTILAAYTGDSLPALTASAANDDADGSQQSRISFRVVGGTVYHIAVDGSGASSGNVVLSWLPVPSNDDFADAQPVSGTFGQVEGSNVNAGSESGEPDHADRRGRTSVWYRWTAPVTGHVKFDTEGSYFDTLLAVYTGDAVGSLVLVRANDDTPMGCCVSRVAFEASEGTVYQIAVAGYFGDTGSIRLNWSPLILGTSGDDTLVGTVGPEEIIGGAGDDTILAGAGDDVIFGGNGDDAISAGGGNDLVTGNRGSDDVNGGAGNDILFDFRGIDRLSGHAGNDRLSTRDGGRDDEVRCGGGTERCFADRSDVRRGCP